MAKIIYTDLMNTTRLTAGMTTNFVVSETLLRLHSLCEKLVLILYSFFSGKALVQLVLLRVAIVHLFIAPGL